MAKNTITQTIALEGGEEIERQLRKIGEAGEQAFSKLGNATKGTEGTLGKIGKEGEEAFSKVEKAAANTAAETVKVASAFESTHEGIIKFAEGVGAALPKIALAAAGIVAVSYAVYKVTQALDRFAEAASKSINATREAAEKAGTSTEKYDALKAVFEDGGVASERFGEIY